MVSSNHELKNIMVCACKLQIIVVSCIMSSGGLLLLEGHIIWLWYALDCVSYRPLSSGYIEKIMRN